MKRSVLATVAALVALLASAPGVYGAELRPLSPQDAARVQQLLSGFDPSTYEFLYKHVDAKGKVQGGRLGGAVGLGNLRQEGTLKGQPGAVASIVAVINIFRDASSVNTINVFKVAAPGQAGFKNAGEQAKANELNAILKNYYR